MKLLGNAVKFSRVSLEQLKSADGKKRELKSFALRERRTESCCQERHMTTKKLNVNETLPIACYLFAAVGTAPSLSATAFCAQDFQNTSRTENKSRKTIMLQFPSKFKY
jgi:hypothetical protein